MYWWPLVWFCFLFSVSVPSCSLLSLSSWGAADQGNGGLHPSKAAPGLLDGLTSRAREARGDKAGRRRQEQRVEKEKGHSRNLLLSIPCLFNMEDKTYGPGPESMMGDRQQPQSGHSSHYWLQTFLDQGSTTSSTFRPVAPTTGPTPVRINGTLGIRKRRQRGEFMLSWSQGCASE